MVDDGDREVPWGGESSQSRSVGHHFLDLLVQKTAQVLSVHSQRRQELFSWLC